MAVRQKCTDNEDRGMIGQKREENRLSLQCQGSDLLLAQTMPSLFELKRGDCPGWTNYKQ